MDSEQNIVGINLIMLFINFNMKIRTIDFDSSVRYACPSLLKAHLFDTLKFRENHPFKTCSFR